MEGNQADCADLLLMRGADAAIATNKHSAPIHSAVSDNKIDVLKVVVVLGLTEYVFASDNCSELKKRIVIGLINICTR